MRTFHNRNAFVLRNSPAIHPGWSPAIHPGWSLGFIVTLFITIIGASCITHAANVVLRYSGGAFYANASSGSRFPSVFLQDRAFCGWSRKPNRTDSIDYVSGERIPASGGTFYMVTSTSGSLRAVPVRKMKKTRKYYRVILVGDSRTTFMQLHLKDCVKKTSYVCKGGSGVGWLENKGYHLLVKKVRTILRNRKKDGSKKKIAVVFNSGVNDLSRYRKYIKVYRKMAAKLKKLHCELFIMSVNPFDAARASKFYGTTIKSRYASDAITFNAKVKKGTAKYYTWIDTWSKLMKTGWTTGNHQVGGDGLHYNRPTCQRIYNFIIDSIG